jgi:hypothetical protein
MIEMNCSGSNKGSPITLPINCIDEIPVEIKVHWAYINFKTCPAKAVMAINMESTEFLDAKDDDGCEQYRIGHYSEEININVIVTPQQMEEFVTKVLEEFRFDVFDGKFTCEPEAQRAQKAKRCEILKKNKRLAIGGGECSVCYVPTTTRTNCKHSVCIPCLSKIEHTRAEDDDEKILRCPMCRDSVVAIY